MFIRSVGVREFTIIGLKISKMDTSKEYIKMCEEAQEIQDNIKPEIEDGDYYIMKGRTIVRILVWSYII